MDKRGQAYLVATVVIVSVLLGLASVGNFAFTRQENIKLYDLSQDLQLEGEKVVNFGILDNEGVDSALRNFTRDYGEYISNKENDVYFIHGDKSRVTVLGYLVRPQGTIGLNFANTASIEVNIDGSIISDQEIVFAGDPNYDPDLDGEINDPNILVNVSNTLHPFKIKKGENFFFIIRQPVSEGRGEVGVSNAE